MNTRHQRIQFTLEKLYDKYYKLKKEDHKPFLSVKHKSHLQIVTNCTAFATTIQKQD